MWDSFKIQREDAEGFSAGVRHNLIKFVIVDATGSWRMCSVGGRRGNRTVRGLLQDSRWEVVCTWARMETAGWKILGECEMNSGGRNTLMIWAGQKEERKRPRMTSKFPI
jgi:hypothetical protein